MRLALLCALLFGCQDISQFEGDGGVGGSGGSAGAGGVGGGGPGGAGGVGAGGGGPGGSGGGGAGGGDPVDPRLNDPIPESGAGCDGAVTVTATLEAGTLTPVFRDDVVRVDYTVDPPNAAVSFRSSVGGNATDRDDHVLFSFKNGDEALWTGRQRVTVVARSGDCVATDEVEMQVAGDFLFGDSKGTVHYIANDGRYLGRYTTIGSDTNYRVLSIAVRASDRNVLVGHDQPDEDLRADPQITRFDGGESDTFETTRPNTDRLWEGSNKPRGIFWEQDADRIWVTGSANENGKAEVYLFNEAGQFDRDGSFSLEHGGVSVGAAVVDGYVYAGAASRSAIVRSPVEGGQLDTVVTGDGDAVTVVPAIEPGKVLSIFRNEAIISNGNGMGAVEIPFPGATFAFPVGRYYFVFDNISGSRLLDDRLEVVKSRFIETGDGFVTLTAAAWLN